MSKFHAAIANINISLANPIDRGDGETPHCYVRTDELAALIKCALAAGEAKNFHSTGCKCSQCQAAKAIEDCNK